MRTRLVAVAGAAFVIAGFAGSARALTYTQTVQFGPSTADYNLGTGLVNGTPATSFYFFDDATGAVLNSVTLSSSYGFSSSITVTNIGSSAASGSVATKSAAQFGATYNGSVIVPSNMVNDHFDATDGNSVTFGTKTLSPIAYDLHGGAANYALAGGTSQTFTSTGVVNTATLVDTTPSDLAAFVKTGGDTFTPLFSTLTGVVQSPSFGSAAAAELMLVTGTMTITYDYSPAVTVPEPASMLLVGAGLAGLGLVRRRPRR